MKAWHLKCCREGNSIGVLNTKGFTRWSSPTPQQRARQWDKKTDVPADPELEGLRADTATKGPWASSSIFVWDVTGHGLHLTGNRHRGTEGHFRKNSLDRVEDCLAMCAVESQGPGEK